MTEYTVLNEVSARHRALMSSKHAMDIQYKCPKCGKDRVITWLFPDMPMIFEDTCHGETIHFEVRQHE